MTLFQLPRRKRPWAQCRASRPAQYHGGRGGQRHAAASGSAPSAPGQPPAPGRWLERPRRKSLDRRLTPRRPGMTSCLTSPLPPRLRRHPRSLPVAGPPQPKAARPTLLRRRVIRRPRRATPRPRLRPRGPIRPARLPARRTAVPGGR